MTREEIHHEMEEAFGLVPLPWQHMPDDFLEQEWALWKNLLAREHHIPDKWRQLIWLAVLSVTGDIRDLEWSAESARMAGATEDEIREVAYLVKWVVGWAPFYRANRIDPERFREQVHSILQRWEREGLPDRSRIAERMSI